jgi:hypothetical protein
MARKRMISPTIWEDPEFNRLSVKARLAFIGLISNADDDGYLRGDYRSLRRLIFGFDDTDDEQWLAELKQLKTVHFFEKDDESFAHMLNWEKYQNQHKDRRQASSYPVCSKCRTSVGQMPDNVGQTTAEVSKLSKGSKDKEVSSGYKNFLKAKTQIGKPV